MAGGAFVPGAASPTSERYLTTRERVWLYNQELAPRNGEGE
jgi:hypothetical protein